MVSPQKAVTRVSLGVDQTPSLPPEAGLNLNLGSYQSDEQGSQVGSCAFPGSFVQPELTSSACWERDSLSLDQHSPDPVVPGRGSPPGGPGMLSWPQGGKNTTLQIPGRPPKMLQEGSDRDC
jgi:hypothetical protein